MTLELSDEQAALLERELTAIIDGDRYFLVTAHSDFARDPQHDRNRHANHSPSRSVMSRRVVADTVDGERLTDELRMRR